MQTDRVLNWYIDKLVDDQYSDGQVFVADRDYSPWAVRVHTKRPPDGGQLELDIKDDGVSIFTNTTPLPNMRKGDSFEEVLEDTSLMQVEIKKYSLLTLHLTANGAAGVSVQLELIAASDSSEVAESDT